jgi:hypothetical protein
VLPPLLQPVFSALLALVAVQQVCLERRLHGREWPGLQESLGWLPAFRESLGCVPQECLTLGIVLEQLEFLVPAAAGRLLQASSAPARVSDRRLRASWVRRREGSCRHQ